MEKITSQGYEVICISAVTGENIKQLLYLISAQLGEITPCPEI